jgi:hypothetical protein
MTKRQATVKTEFVSEEERTAYHEAGHAVINHLTGLGIKKITIVSTQSRLGNVDPVIQVGPWLNCSKQNIKTVCLASCGGYAAEFVVDGKAALDQTDAVTLEGLLQELDVAEEAMRAHTKRFWVRAIRMLKKNWPAVEALADPLLRHGELSGEQATQIIN